MRQLDVPTSSRSGRMGARQRGQSPTEPKSTRPISLPESNSHQHTDRSWLVLKNVLASTNKTDVIQFLWPAMVRTTFSLAQSHTRRVWSWLPETSVLPSAANAKHVTAFV